jgi:hypothetical protein
MDHLSSDKISVVRDLERNSAVSVDESLSAAQLEQPHDHVDRNESIGNYRNCSTIEIVVTERHYHEKITRFA